jgi:hypothetical protein
MDVNPFEIFPLYENLGIHTILHIFRYALQPWSLTRQVVEDQKACTLVNKSWRKLFYTLVYFHHGKDFSTVSSSLVLKFAQSDGYFYW